jgi:hypothetical protein
MQEWDPTQLKELANEEEQIVSEYSERYKPHQYRQAFYPPPGSDWAIDASFIDSYFESAKLILRGIVHGSLPEGIAGPSACFLCRHYLELALKYTLFHSRWLRDENHNAPDDEVEPVAKVHRLLDLWKKLDSELKSRMPSILKTGLDLKYVDQFVAEFDRVDDNGERFRYPRKRVALESGAHSQSQALGIDFELLLYSLELTHDVLETVDAYLIEQYGQNQDWKAELDSL